jgi:hypothetical protein
MYVAPKLPLTCGRIVPIGFLSLIALRVASGPFFIPVLIRSPRASILALSFISFLCCILCSFSASANFALNQTFHKPDFVGTNISSMGHLSEPSNMCDWLYPDDGCAQAPVPCAYDRSASFIIHAIEPYRQHIISKMLNLERNWVPSLRNTRLSVSCSSLPSSRASNRTPFYGDPVDRTTVLRAIFNPRVSSSQDSFLRISCARVGRPAPLVMRVRREMRLPMDPISRPHMTRVCMCFSQRSYARGFSFLLIRYSQVTMHR